MELQKLLIEQCGGKYIMCVIDGDNHTSWFEVGEYEQAERFDTYAAAESAFNRIKG